MTTCYEEGSPNAPLCFIVEAPAATEIRHNRPLVGPSGDIFDWCLAQAFDAPLGRVRTRFRKENLYILNLWPWKVGKDKEGNIYSPNGELLCHRGSVLTAKGLEEAQPFFTRLRASSCRVIVPMGAPAFNALTGMSGVTKYRGSPMEWEGRRLLPTLHPAHAIERKAEDNLSSAEIGSYHIRLLIVEDMKKAHRFLDGHKPLERELVIDPSYKTVLDFLEETRRHSLFATDMECSGSKGQITCFSVSFNPKLAISIPLLDAEGRNRWTLNEEYEILSKFRALMLHEEIEKVNQAILADLWAYAATMGILYKGPIHDIMTAYNIIYPGLKRKDLGTILSTHTDEVYYKDDAKIFFEGKGTARDMPLFWQYSAKDSAVALEAWVGNSWSAGLREELKDGFQAAYDMTMRVYPALLDMMLRGVRIEGDKLDETCALIDKSIRSKQAQLNEVCGEPLNISSPKQVKDYFYVKLAMDPYRNRKTGKATTDDKALAKIVRKKEAGWKEASLIQEIRKETKLQKSYMEVSWDEDNRLRCSWNPRGTITGRLSSSQTLFNTGMNFQNPHPMFSSFLLADEGHILLEFDKKGAEWVVVAYEADEPNMIRTCETKGDPHTATGTLITGIPPDLILKEHKLLGNETDPTKILTTRMQELTEILEVNCIFLPRVMSVRQAGKKSNHGLNYGEGYNTFAEINEIPVSEAKKIRDLYYNKAYPNIGEWQKAIQEELRANNRCLTNCFGRKVQLLGGWNNKLFNQAYSIKPQSTVSDIVVQAMAEFHESIDYHMQSCILWNNKHDSATLQAPLSLGAKGIAKVIYEFAHEERYLNPLLKSTTTGKEYRIDTECKIGFAAGYSMKEITIPPDYDKIADSVEAYLDKIEVKAA